VLKNRDFRVSNIILTVLLFVAFGQGFSFAGEQQAIDLLAYTVQQSKHQRFQASGVSIRPSGMLAFDIERAGLSERITERGELARYIVNAPLTQLTVYPALKKGIKQKGRIKFQPLAYLNSNLIEALKSYDLLSDPKFTQLAGRVVRRLSITSKGHDRYSYVYWIDEKSSAILRLDIIDENKALIERMVLTSFAHKPSLLPVVNSNLVKDIDWKQQRFKPISQSKLQVSWMPIGFKLYSIESITGDIASAHCERLMLTDGFALVEVYSCENNHIARLSRGQQLDALHIIKRRLAGRALSIEGYLPSVMLNKIAENIEIKND